MHLSSTEYQVCDNIARGYQVKEIADMMCRSPYTIDTHIKNVKKKNSLNNIADITREFIRSLDKPDDWFKTLTVAAFISLQTFITFGSDVDDFRANRTASRTVKTVRTTSGRKPTYYG